MRIRYGHLALAAGIGAGLPAWAADGNGLQASDASWFHGRWESRIEWNLGLTNPRHSGPYTLVAAAPRHPLRGWAALRDYYFDDGDTPSYAPTTTGLRATGGLLVTPRSTLTSASPRRGSLGSPGLTLPTLSTNGWQPQDALVPVPYVGVGYSDLSSRSGWGFRADLGLMALHPQSAVKLGSTLSGAQGVDTLLNSLQLSPVLQIGVSYSF